MELKELKMILQTPTHLLKAYLSDLSKDHGFKISKYPFNFFDSEDKLACFLFDVHHFPFDMVMERFEKEGGRIIRIKHV